jgi:hypothetical protein
VFWPVADAASRAYLADLGSCCSVILLTARDWARGARPADFGVTAVVAKPFDLDRLLGTLASVAQGRTVTGACPADARARYAAV